eukprot:SAG11_NODE_2540_length_3240_cov_5.748886_4_plen_73_part_00
MLEMYVSHDPIVMRRDSPWDADNWNAADALGMAYDLCEKEPSSDRPLLTKLMVQLNTSCVHTQCAPSLCRAR